MGLQSYPRSEILGALEHNLGLVEDQAGDRAAACDRLPRSLAARRRNQATVAKAAALACGP